MFSQHGNLAQLRNQLSGVARNFSWGGAPARGGGGIGCWRGHNYIVFEKIKKKNPLITRL